MEKYPNQRLYEWLDTEIRFASLADIILDRQGKEVATSHSSAAPKKVAYWTTPNEVFRYRLEKKDLGELGGRHYLLEQFEAKRKNSDSATARFFVEIWKDGVTPIEKLDSKDTPLCLDPLERKTAIKYAMSILTEAAKEDAQKIFNKSIAQRFPLIAASYILSDLAIQNPGNEPTINRTAITMQSMDFLKQMVDMESYIAELSTDEEGVIDLDYFAHLASPPDTNQLNEFKAIDLRPALEQVANEVGSSWHNTITPSHHDFI